MFEIGKTGEGKAIGWKISYSYLFLKFILDKVQMCTDDLKLIAHPSSYKPKGITEPHRPTLPCLSRARTTR
jgi:hypothetical protein